MISLWEQESFLNYDVIIVGAGISGLSTAASLKEKASNLNILVIERGTLPVGASTRNAGFACFGSISELANDRLTLGDQGMAELVKRRWDGLQKTIKRLGADHIDFEKKGGYELLTPENEYFADQVDEVNELLYPLFGDPVFLPTPEKIKPFGFRKTSHLIFNQFEGQLHTGKLMRSLWRYCGERGIHIITGSEVTDLTRSGDYIEVKTASNIFFAKAVGVCTNAFTPKLLKKEMDVNPGRGLVMAVTPDKPLPFEGTFHYNEGYYYFRDFNNKLIFGGGRNMALEEETTTAFEINERILDHLHEELKDRILPDMKYSTELVWSGIMAFGANKKPILADAGERIFLGVRLGGMGVAIGSLVGEELADMILEKHF